MQKRMPHIEELPAKAPQESDHTRSANGSVGPGSGNGVEKPLKSQDFMPEKNPDLALDYLFEMLCAARRISRINQFQFIAYLIEMAILEVDNERRTLK